MMHFQHTVRPDDNARLQALMNNDAISGSVKTLARILSTLNHTPSAADKAQLTQLLQAPE